MPSWRTTVFNLSLSSSLTWGLRCITHFQGFILVSIAANNSTSSSWFFWVDEKLQRNDSDYERGKNNGFSPLFKAEFFEWRWRVILVLRRVFAPTSLIDVDGLLLGCEDFYWEVPKMVLTFQYWMRARLTWLSWRGVDSPPSVLWSLRAVRCWEKTSWDTLCLSASEAASGESDKQWYGVLFCHGKRNALQLPDSSG